MQRLLLAGRIALPVRVWCAGGIKAVSSPSRISPRNRNRAGLLFASKLIPLDCVLDPSNKPERQNPRRHCR